MKKEKAATQAATLSKYGDDDQRHHNPFISTASIMLVYFMYITSSMIPLLLVLFLAAIALGLIERYVLAILATMIAVDFAIPLPDGYKPNAATKASGERLFAEGMQHYFPARSIFLPKKLDKEKAYILAAWPHGLMGGGGHVGFADFSQRGFNVIYTGASIMRYVPFVRRLLHSWGFTDVSKGSLGKVLNVRKYGPTYPNNVAHLVVGGIHEMFYTPYNSNKEQIILDKRKGFIKLALTNQCDIIPMYTFGANQQYQRIFGHESVLCKLSTSLQMSLVVWLGRWKIPMSWIPIPVPLLGVVGEVFEVPKVDSEKITDELVQQVHSDFCERLKKLFDDYKKVYVDEMGADPEWLTRELKLETE